MWTAKFVRTCAREEGQAIVFLALAMSLFLLGAAGLAVDGSHLYAQRQMAQTAADAAVQAGMMSVFGGTNTAGGAAFSTGSGFTCSTSDARTPCKYAALNGFGTTSGDSVLIDYPATASVPGVTFGTTPTYPVTLMRVRVSRAVNTTLMRFLTTSTATTVNTQAMAAIVSVVSPVPIIVNHPTLSGAFATNGGITVTICGGPSRSIQVNSNSTTATTTAGNSNSIDLSHAGPADPGNCTTGTGADFGVTGGPSTTSFNYNGGSTGVYRPLTAPVPDPLGNVPVPTVPAAAPATTPLAYSTSGCPANKVVKKACVLYSPGLYTTEISGDNATPVFKPGIYYLQAGMECKNNCALLNATGFTDASTGWTDNVLFYNTGTGTFDLGADGTINLIGSPITSTYKGILFFQDRTAAAATHTLSGGGGMSLQGSIYMTNTRATMLATSTKYQTLSLQGSPGSTTTVQGEIIVDSLTMGGNAGITMELPSTGSLSVDQVAMVN